MRSHREPCRRLSPASGVLHSIHAVANVILGPGASLFLRASDLARRSDDRANGYTRGCFVPDRSAARRVWYGRGTDAAFVVGSSFYEAQAGARAMDCRPPLCRLRHPQDDRAHADQRRVADRANPAGSARRTDIGGGPRAARRRQSSRRRPASHARPEPHRARPRHACRARHGPRSPPRRRPRSPPDADAPSHARTRRDRGARMDQGGVARGCKAGAGKDGPPCTGACLRSRWR